MGGGRRNLSLEADSALADADRLARALDAQDASALLIVAGSSRDPDMAPFAGGSRLGESFVLAPAGGAPRLGFLSSLEREEAAASGLRLLDPETLEVRRALRHSRDRAELWARVLARALAEVGVERRSRVAVAGHCANGDLDGALRRLRRAGWGFVSGNRIALRLRKRKGRAELHEMRRVARCTAAVFHDIAAVLAGCERRRGKLLWQGKSLTVGGLRRQAATGFAALGLEQPEGNLIAVGREGAVPHNTGRDETVLSEGESIVVDLFPRRRLFADCTRTFCVGQPPDALVAAHSAVGQALEIARQGARPGVRGWTLQKRVCRYFEEQGYATPLRECPPQAGYVHGLGHGVGFEVHELPEFRAESGEADGLLEAGDVFTLEPGLYDPEEGYGVRIEDLCFLGETGVESLTSLPTDLDPRRWLEDRDHGP